MQFQENAAVISADGQEIGRIDRVVLNPQTKTVTHLVIRPGFFTEDKLLPVQLVAVTSRERVMLLEKATDLQDLPLFEEIHFIPAEDTDPDANLVRPFYWSPRLTTGKWGYLGYPLPVEETEPRKTETTRNIPDNTVALKGGATVISADGQQVGNVERILTQPQGDRATHFVVSQGWLFKERRVIPISWISTIDEEEVRLFVSADRLGQLPKEKD